MSTIPSAAAPKSGAATSGKGMSASGLDTGTVRNFYMDGDFDPAIDLLETSLRRDLRFSHEDSVFIFKHLGVMYAARYETREKGKHYMHRLLEVEPTARILDMYASDMIYMIFKNIQDEFEASRQRLHRADRHLARRDSMPAPEPEKAAAKKPGGSGRTLLWIGAGVAVAAGVATYWALSDSPTAKTVDHSVE